MKRFLLTAAATALLCSTSYANAETLTIWWSKGYYAGEDIAFKDIVDRFEKEAGVKVDLSLYQAADMNVKTVAAIEAGSVPDVAYGDQLASKLSGRWAFDGRLADLSDVLEPLKSQFDPAALAAGNLLDGKTGTRHYYAFPLASQALASMIWTDMLSEVGLKETDIPRKWDDYWTFWCEKVQPALRAKGKRVYAIGMPYGVGSGDASNVFVTFMDAYKVKLVNQDGSTRFDEPDVRENLEKALESYTGLYKRGCAPPSSVTWQDPDNNQYFHSRQTVMTWNYSISIPGKWLDDSKNANLSEEDRKNALDSYQNKMITAAPPEAADGQPMKARANYLTGIVFKDAQHVDLAKKFLSFFLKDENIGPYIEASKGRLFPAKKSSAETAFWQSDRHLKAYSGIYKAGTIGWDYNLNYKLANLNNESVWAKAAGKVITQDITILQAVDELLADMKRLTQ